MSHIFSVFNQAGGVAKTTLAMNLGYELAQLNRYKNDNPRARWSRSGNGTPPWANRNYERPEKNSIRQELKRQDREYRKYERNVRKNGKWLIAALPYKTFSSYYDYDPKDKRRAHRDRRHGLAERRREYYRYPAPIVYYTPQVENWFSLAAYSEPNYYGQYSYGDVGRDRSYYSEPYYGDRHYDYDNDDYYWGEDEYYGREDWRNSLFRMILGAVFGRSDVGYFDRPAYAGRYDQYYPQPVYYYAEPMGSYDPFYINAYSDPFAKHTFERAAATGYCRGYMDAMNARRFGINDYYHPYAYSGGWFDNYSASFTERQRLLSQGYELGYRDAMANRDHYGIAEGGGTLDLVSVLLENVLLSGAI
ncbi:ParA family protein [Leptolyngbya sp. 7M]|uniref:ParA family protein n=1 Tax=Leptolyngbya sp. 7M TaxID=2812896 RepID=UPI001B8D69F5|nr:ParA family protein [Leptolyngbya sp. 7M]QYO62055.1 ParA family protein [Leptolyngbya sp. 7M]